MFCFVCLPFVVVYNVLICLLFVCVFVCLLLLLVVVLSLFAVSVVFVGLLVYFFVEMCLLRVFFVVFDFVISGTLQNRR